MGEILNSVNLRSYTSARYRDRLPNWPLPDLLYGKVPVLAYRDYLNGYVNREWPLCWQDERRIIPALRMTVSILKSWRATRRKGGSERILRLLEPRFSAIVRELQRVFRAHSVKCVSSLRQAGNTHNEIVYQMANAVSEVAEIVKTASRFPSINPMLGSKILSFFFPDFFPVWDTKWISKVLKTTLREFEQETCQTEIESRLSSNGAGQAYACYVRLMIQDSWDTTETEYKRLRAECIELCVRAGYDRSKHILHEFFYDLTQFSSRRVCSGGLPEGAISEVCARELRY